MASRHKEVAPPPAAERYEMLRLDQLRESPLNPRKRFNAHRLEELAESIKERGVITPLIVREAHDALTRAGGSASALLYEIAAGHRRFRAAMSRGVEPIPCRIMDLDDKAFREIITIENVQREDVHPLEEADGYRELLNRNGYDVATLADKTGKTEAYIRGRLELCDLIPVARESFLQDAITIGHARLISRLDPAKQEEALRDCFERNWQTQSDELISLKAFRRKLLHESGADLSKAPFALDDPSLKSDAGACTTCPKCTGVQLLLIPDAASEQTCLDRACYSQKVNAHVMRKTAAGLVAISTHYSGEIPAGVASAREYALAEPDDDQLAELREDIEALRAELDTPTISEEDRADTERELEERRKELAEAEAEHAACPHVERAVLVHGNASHGLGIGTERRICRNQQCPIHGEALQDRINRFRETGSKEKTFAEIWRDKRKDLDDKIKIEARRELIRRVYDACPGKPDLVMLTRVAERLDDLIGHDPTAELITHVLKLDAPKAKYGNGKDTGAVLEQLRKDAAFDPAKVWKLIILMTVACTTQGYGGEDELKAIAEHLKIDAKAVTKAVSDPLVEAFNAKKAAAQAKEKAAKKADKPAPAKKASKSSKMAAAGDDEDGDE